MPLPCARGPQQGSHPVPAHLYGAVGFTSLHLGNESWLSTLGLS